ncbi:hypothetical protein EB001_05170 [bacterium]|jgi:hypothetical protein|nr:hypothetical protein [bacterium]
MDENIEPSGNENDSQEAGLLDSAAIETEAKEANPNATEVSHLAKDDASEDDEPLERPDWWPENFWKKDESEPDLEAIAKSWTDLRKQISQGKHKAPADGNYDVSAFGTTPEDDPVRQHVVTWAKDYGVSQAALDALVSKVVEMGGTNTENVKMSLEQEKKALGPNADARINGMIKWANGLVQKGVWGKDDFEEFKVMGGTAKGIAALEKLRGAFEGKIPVESSPVEGAPSKEELYAMVADPKYKSDPGYRSKVERMFQASFGS